MNIKTAAMPRLAGPWRIVALGFFALAFAFTVRGALSMAMPSWQAEFGWTRTEISGIAAIALLVMASVAPFAGHMVDCHGPRPLLIAGLVAIGVGVVMVTLARPGGSSWLLPVGFSMVAAVGFGAVAQHVIAAAIAQRFESHRGLATGIGTAGSTAGQLLLMPVLAWLMLAGQWRSAFWLLAAGCFILIPLAWLMLSQPGSKELDVAGEAVSEQKSHHEKLSHNLPTLLKSPAFHAIFWSYAICGFTTSGVIETHLLPYADLCGFGPVPSATAYGVLSALNLVGMIVAGGLSDVMHQPRLLACIYALRALSFVLLMFVGDDYSLLVLFAIVFGLVDYSTVPVTASFIASKLGVRLLGLAMGLLSAGHAIGAATGAWLGGALFDRNGGYGGLWTSAVFFSLAAALLVVGLQDPDRRWTRGLRRSEA